MCLWFFFLFVVISSLYIDVCFFGLDLFFVECMCESECVLVCVFYELDR